MLAATALVIQSCSTLLATSGNTDANNTVGDSTITLGAQGVVGSSNTGNTFRNGTSQGVQSTDATANSTGPSPSPDEMDGSNTTPSIKRSSVSSADYTQWFLVEAALSGITEVKLSKIALTRTQNNTVKSYASMILIDHVGTDEHLQTLAASKNVTLPDPAKIGNANSNSVNNSSSANLNEKVNTLSQLADDQFDKIYIRMIIKDTQDAVKFFEQGAKSSDPDVSAYARKYLPQLKMHLKKVNYLRAKTKKNNAPN